MSRIGKHPVPVPKGVTVEIAGSRIVVKGPKGQLERALHPSMKVAMVDGQVSVQRPDDQERHKALHGLSRTLVANMVEGVATGFERVLEIQGVGYRAEAKGKALTLVVGLSHPVTIQAPDSVTLTVENNTIVKVAGPNKELVGQVAAEIRSIRPPEPYKGKGIRYQGERVRRKAGKTGAK